MGLLDNLRDRLTGNYSDDYEDDDYYDDYDDDGYEGDDYEQPRGSGILGNTSRPEAESVAVYTRSGRPVGTNAGAPSQDTSPRSQPQARSASSAYTSYRNRRDDYESGFDDGNSYTPRPTASLNASGQLPPYVLRAEGYEDVQTVVRRVRTNQPVLLVLNDTDPAVAQRIIDFCYGLAFGIGGEMAAVDGKVFVVMPADIQMSQADLDRLAQQVR